MKNRWLKDNGGSVELKHVRIYTDGGCINNPGPGGYGVVLLYDDRRKELSGGFRRTTNNRMEILAAIIGLEALKVKCQVTLHSDSQYLVNAIQKGWAAKWRAQGWWRNKNKSEPALNPDLWERLLSACDRHEVEFLWIRGHAGNSENERCDELAKAAAKGSGLAVDRVYEENNP
jgi:ribonuclease HI